MAGSFKTACPSCEADVVVKGRNLIGKKIDCTKCKYRFTVPDPDGGTDDGLAEPKPKAKKNNQKTVGIILGVVAAAVLVGGGIMMFMGDDDKPKTTTPNNTRNNNANNNTPKDNTNTAKADNTKTPEKKDEKVPPKKDETINEGPKFIAPDKIDPNAAKENKTLPKNNTVTAENLRPVDPSKLRDPSNLLPGASMAVLALNFDRLKQTPIYEPFFDAPMQEFFERSMAFASADMVSAHFCLVNATREPFVVIRTRKPISLNAMKAEMALQATPNSPIQQRSVYNIGNNAFVQALGRVVSAEALRSEAGIPITDEEKKKWGEDQKMALHLYDTQTVMIGELNTVERYLSDLTPSGDPVFQKLPPAAAPAAPPADPNAQPAAPPPATTFKRDYLTIHPGMKEMFNKLEEKPASALYVDRWNQRSFLLDSRDLLDGDIVGLIIRIVLQTVDIVGISIQQMNKDKFAGVIALKYLSEVDMKDSVEKAITPIIDGYLKGLLQGFFGTKIEVSGTGGGSSSSSGGGGGGARGSSEGGGIPVPAGGSPDNPNDPGGFSSTSKISINQAAEEFLCTIDFDINISGNQYKNVVLPQLLDTITQMKGRMSVLSGDTSPYALSTRTAARFAEKQAYPPGTLKRNAGGDRFNLDYPPDLRCSLFVEMLPYLGKSGLRSQIQDGTVPWYDKRNMKAATTWVPEFLVPYYPQTAWRAYHPLAEGGTAALGATNYVALSGLGRDSARFDPKDPANAKLLGITGYNWNSTMAQISDGTSNTIYMVQVPPNHSRPWIAGGGATVVGVDPENPLADLTYRPKEGKAGTYALMADGSVRFVPDTTDKKIFNAMVTRAGGEDLGDLDGKLALEPRPKHLKPAELKASKTAQDSNIDPAELRKFEGKWQVIAINVNNKAMPLIEVENAKITIEFSEKRMIVRNPKQPDETGSILMIDAKANPKRLLSKGPDGKIDPAIYAFEDKGDKLRLCMKENAANDKDFPKSIAPGANVTVFEMVKVKE